MKITASAIKEWNTCKRRYRYKYIDLVRLAETGKALAIGTAFHAGLEAFLEGRGYAMDMLSAASDTLDESFWARDDANIEWQRVIAMLGAYRTQWVDLRRHHEVIAIEQQWGLHVAPGVEMAGKFDAVCRTKSDGQLWVWEHKTSSEEIATLGDPYWLRLALDSQLTVYAQAAAGLYGEPVKVLYDVARKPIGKPKMKKAIAKRKTETPEEYQARKDAARETLAEFGERLKETMLAEPGKYLVRHEVVRSAAETRLLKLELFETLLDMRDYQGSYPRNDGACTGRYGVCPYLGVCTGMESLDDARFTRLQTAHPELEPTKEDSDDKHPF